MVYIASPHALHLEHARLAFEAGKHVLCEKPLTLSVAEAEEMIALATEHDRFLMEAMWTACHPVILEVQRRIRAGDLGTPRHLHAELGFVVPPDASTRMHDPALGASALLDMGIYPLTLAHLMLGEAEELVATAHLSDDGIDLDVAISGRYPGGALASMSASMTSWSSRRAEIATDTGRLSLEDFHHPDFATWVPFAGTRRRHRRRSAADHRRGPGHRPRLRPRDRRGGPLPRRRAEGEPARPARADADDPAPDGRGTPPGRRRLPRADGGHEPRHARG